MGSFLGAELSKRDRQVFDFGKFKESEIRVSISKDFEYFGRRDL